MKKIITFFLMAAMLLTLCACKKSADTPAETEPTTEPVETAPDQVWLMTEKATYFPNGNLSTLTTRTYTETGDVVQYVEMEYDYDGGEYSRSSYTYNEKGDLTEYAQTVEGNLLVFEAHTYTYDANGNITAQSCQDANGQQMWRREHLFDAQNRPPQTLQYDRDDQLSSTIDYTYDEKGYPAQTREYTPLDMEVSRYDYAYNDGGKLLSEAYYESEVLVYSEEFTYDENGNAIEVTHFEAWDESTTRSVYEYDDQGRKTKHLRYGENGRLEYHSEDLYDEAGNRYVHKEYNELGEEANAYYTLYDDRGNLAVEIYTYATVESTRYTRKYDADGRLTEKLSYYKGELDITTTYAYDENGNCISATDTTSSGESMGWITYAYVSITADGELAETLRAEQEALLMGS